MTLAQVKQKFLSAQKALEDAILSEMDKVARRHKLDKMIFGFESHLTRDGKDVELKRITQLDEMYCDLICAGGFQGLWSKEEGWH